MKKKTIIIIAVCAVLLLALAATGVMLWLNNQPDAPEQNSDLRVDLITVIPAAYMNEQYDLKQIIEMQEGVEYSAQVFYQNYDTMEEFELPLTDLVFCQKEDFDVNVIFTAKRGEETAQRALNIPVNIRADEIDELFSTNGLAGYADSGIVKNLNVDPQYLVNKDSKTSLVVGFQGASTHDYGHVFVSLAKEAVRPLYTDQSWENAAVSFWVYNPLEYDVEFQMRLVYTELGVDTDWTNREDADRRIAKPGQWTQIVFSLRKYGIEKMVTNLKDHVQVKMQYLGRPALGEQYAYSVYIDGIDIVDASAFPDLDTNSTVSNESIEQGWENILQDAGWQSARTIFDYGTVMGEGSTCSLHAKFPEVNVKEGYFVVLSQERSRGKPGMKNLPDMTAGTLTGYFKFENASPGVEVYLVKWVNGKWMTSNRILMDLEAVGDGWYKGSLDVYGFEFPSDRNDEIIRTVFTFTGAHQGSEVWMDTVKFEPKDMVKVKEPAQKDWINLPTDGGMSKGTYYNYTINRVKAKGSVRSVKIIAPRNKEGTLVFNPESGVGVGMLNKLPDMRKGTLHAWFYFGKQEPKASVRVYNAKWGCSNKSSSVDFIFEDMGDGWYYGSVPASLLESYYVGDGSQILRVALIIPAGYTVYVDGLMHYPQEVYKTKFDPDELFASGLFITEGIKQGNGYAFVTDVTNGSTDAVTMWATEKTGWPKVGIKFTEPVDFSSYTHINLDVKNVYFGEDWVGVYVDYLDADGNVKRAGVGTEIIGEDWHTLSIPLAKFANADIEKIMGVMVCANFQDRLKEGVLNQLWYDNLHLSVEDPPPTPQNPVATEEDNDLISGSYTATADIAGIRGILKVAADDAGEAKSNSMLLMWANSPSGWPKATFLFDSEQDWSEMDYLTLDTKIIGTHPWVSVEIINRAEDGSLVYSKGGAYDTTTGAWNTHRIYMYSFRDVDLSKVCGIRINVNLQEELTEGTLAQVYIDNVNVVEKPVLLEDNDLLATCQVVCTSVTKLAAYMQSDVTNNSNQALKMEVIGDGYFRWPKATLTLKDPVSEEVESFTVDVERTCSDLNFRVEFLDANDAVLGNHVVGTEENGWQTHTFKLAELSVDPVLDTELTQIAKIRFTFYLAEGLTAGDAMYLDNAAFLVATDTDLLATSQIAYGSVSESTKLAASVQSTVTNDSNQALKIEVTDASYFRWPKATLTLKDPVSAKVESFTVDVERTCSDLNFRVEFLDANDTVLGNHVVGTEEDGWQTHTFKLSELSVDPVLDAEVTQIAKIRFTFYFAEGLTAGDAMYIDNAAFIKQTNEDLIDSSTIVYAGVSEENKLEASLQSDVTNGSEQAIMVEIQDAGYFRWPKATLTLAEGVPEGIDSFTVDVERTCSDWNFRVEFLDANDAVRGNHLIGTGEKGWQTHTFKLSEMSVDGVTDDEIAKIAKIRFTFYFAEGLTVGDAMYIDNAAFTRQAGEDLIDSSTIVYDRVSEENKLEASLQSDVTNGSEQAIKVEIQDAGYSRWPIITMSLADGVSANTTSFTVDVERTCSDWNFRVEFLDENNNVLGNHLIGTGENGWQTHKFKLSEMSVDSVDSSEVTKIAKVRFTMYFLDGLSAGDAMYIDNASFLVV